VVEHVFRLIQILNRFVYSLNINIHVSYYYSAPQYSTNSALKKHFEIRLLAIIIQIENNTKLI